MYNNKISIIGTGYVGNLEVIKAGIKANQKQKEYMVEKLKTNLKT